MTNGGSTRLCAVRLRGAEKGAKYKACQRHEIFQVAKGRGVIYIDTAMAYINVVAWKDIDRIDLRLETIDRREMTSC